MPVHETYATTTTVQGRDADNTLTTTIPADIVDELGLERDEPLLWQCDEGDGFARVKRPNR